MAANPASLPAAEAQTPAQINHFARLTGVIFDPKATFAEIVVAPTWIMPMVVLVLMGL